MRVTQYLSLVATYLLVTGLTGCQVDDPVLITNATWKFQGFSTQNGAFPTTVDQYKQMGYCTLDNAYIKFNSAPGNPESGTVIISNSCTSPVSSLQRQQSIIATASGLEAEFAALTPYSGETITYSWQNTNHSQFILRRISDAGGYGVSYAVTYSNDRKAMYWTYTNGSFSITLVWGISCPNGGCP